MKKSLAWLTKLSITKKVMLGLGTLFVLSTAANAPQADLSTQSISNAGNAPAAVQKAAIKPAVTTKFSVETVSIPFTSTTVEDATLAKGTSKITTAGVAGSKTLTYKVTYTDGKQTAKELVSTKVDKEPVTQVTSIGTHVAQKPACTNGSYINTAGVTVCRPVQSISIPAGATAKCADGSFSFSLTHSGTCSHHGGVSVWY
jgi:hypothetical protein